MNEPTQVQVVDVNIPIASMVGLIFKAVAALLLAAVILGGIAFIASSIIGIVMMLA